jgi:hypothetical protein
MEETQVQQTFENIPISALLEKLAPVIDAAVKEAFTKSLARYEMFAGLPDCITASEMAEVIRVKKDTLEKWRNTDKFITYYKQGYKYGFYRKDELLRWLKDHPKY